jgi:hypothetical protein
MIPEGYKISYSHSSADEDLSLLRCDTVSLVKSMDWLPLKMKETQSFKTIGDHVPGNTIL